MGPQQCGPGGPGAAPRVLHPVKGARGPPSCPFSHASFFCFSYFLLFVFVVFCCCFFPNSDAEKRASDAEKRASDAEKRVLVLKISRHLQKSPENLQKTSRRSCRTLQKPPEPCRTLQNFPETCRILQNTSRNSCRIPAEFLQNFAET